MGDTTNRKRRATGLELYPPGKIAKSPYWYIRGTYRGEKVFRSTGQTTKPRADFIRNVEREIDDRLSSEDEGITFAEAVILYSEDCPEGERKYIKVLLHHFKETLITDIDSGTLKDAAKKLYPGRKPATWNRNCITPASAIIHAAHEHWPKKVPLIQLSRFREEKPRTSWATPKLAIQIVKALPVKRQLWEPSTKGKKRVPTGRYVYPRAFALFCFKTGRRMADGINLTWDNVNEAEKWAHIPKTKNGTEVYIPLDKEVLTALKGIDTRTGRVFGYSHRRQFLDDWQAACKKLKIEYRRSEGGLTPHSMRHSFGTWLRQKGFDRKAIKEAGGWESDKAVDRYLHLFSDERDRAFEAMPDLMGEDDE